MKVYLNWFIINFIICLLPLIFSALIILEISDNIISSFIAFSFTSLVTSLYIYDRDETLESPLKWSSFALILILLFLYVYFPSLMEEDVKAWVANNLSLCLGTIFLLTLLFSLFLNNSSIQDIIQKERNKEKFIRNKSDRGEMEKMIDKLKEDRK